MEARLSKNRRDLRSIVSAREDLVLALYEGLSIESPDLKGNYDSREALCAANTRYINLLNDLIGYWKETREALEARDSDIEHLNKHLRSALETVSENKRQIDELQEKYDKVKISFAKFIDTATEDNKAMKQLFIELRNLSKASDRGEGEETASQEAE